MGAAKAAVATVATASDTPDVVLATFDGAKGTTFKWKDLNDPFMGGASTSTFHVDNKVGVFNGTCAIVKFLKAPGFAKIDTSSGWFSHDHFNDASSCLNGTIDLKVRSSTSSYKGFKVGFGAKNVPKSSTYGGASFKAGFQLKASSDSGRQGPDHRLFLGLECVHGPLRHQRPRARRQA